MKLSSIKTKSEFYEFADIWYQRTHKLRRIWQDEKETTERAMKALKLWDEMKDRVLYLGRIATQIEGVRR